MGQLSKDTIQVVDGKIIFIPSGSTTLGVSQSIDSVAQQYVVTMSGASLSQSVLAPANATSSFWYFRTPDAHSFKVFYQNENLTSVEPTGSIFSLGDLPNSLKSTRSGSAIQVNLEIGSTGSAVTVQTLSALQTFRSGKNRYIASGSQNTYIHITNVITGEPPADDINFSHISGSSISYHVQTSGSGGLRGIASEGTPDTGSAEVRLQLNETDKDQLETAMEDSRSFINVKDGHFGVSVTEALTGSNISMHGGIPLDIGFDLPNPAYIKTVGGFDILMDNANSHDNTKFRIFKDTGIAGISPGTEILTLDNDGNLTVAGTISNASGSVDGGSF